MPFNFVASDSSVKTYEIPKRTGDFQTGARNSEGFDNDQKSKSSTYDKDTPSVGTPGNSAAC
jgi:hypothetical protein